MDRVRGPVEMIRYGHDEETIYLAFEGSLDALKEPEASLLITIEENGCRCSLPMQNAEGENGARFAIGERVELALPRTLFEGHDFIHLRFEIVRGDEIIQTLPGHGALAVDMAETYAQHWFV